MTVYTSGDWYTVRGAEDAFVEAWRELFVTALAEVDSHGSETLLRDKGNPQHFVSIGKWRDETAVALWRDGAGLAAVMDELRPLLETVDTSVYEVIDTVGPQLLAP